MVIAMIFFLFIFSTAEFYPKFRESGIIQTLIKIIKKQGVNPQTCYNAMAVLESFSLRGLLCLSITVVSRLLHRKGNKVSSFCLVSVG